jgi:hypothetical protein
MPTHMVSERARNRSGHFWDRPKLVRSGIAKRYVRSAASLPLEYTVVYNILSNLSLRFLSSKKNRKNRDHFRSTAPNQSKSLCPEVI